MAVKSDLRRQFLNQRQSLDPDRWQQHSHRICQHLRHCNRFQQAHTILAYWSFRREPDLSSLWTLPKRWGLPRCVDKTLVWHRWSLGQALAQDRYGIWSPQADAPQIPGPQGVDLMLVPALACDRRGYRLGYGGGFYDRLLGDEAWQRVTTLGIIFADSLVDTLPHDSWDCPLDGVCTEAGVEWYGSPAT
ncbi:MAG: 5-formyltetrahydrofolate cyclo-ligase [Prochlorothrix sp.]|nr:5-formyltetrahydrofolate cyclo-ligase [Prochlorothrix sp.]